MNRGARHRDIGQFHSRLGGSQHQPAATHVPTPHEFGRKHETFREYVQQRRRIFIGSDAAQQDEVACRIRRLFQKQGIAQQSVAEGVRIAVDRNIANGPQLSLVDRCCERQ